MSNKGFASDRAVLMDVEADRSTVVDLEDALVLSAMRWFRDGKYIATGAGFRIHRVIMRPGKGEVIHHKNEDL